jgi:hypothetical protein
MLHGRIGRLIDCGDLQNHNAPSLRLLQSLLGKSELVRESDYPE